MDDQLKELIKESQLAFQARRFKQCEELATRILDSKPGLADVHNMLGLVHHQQGHFDLAIKSFEKALKINPSYAEASLNLTVTYNDLGHYKEARHVYKKTKQRSKTKKGEMESYAKGKMANRHAETGDIYRRMNCHNEALEEYEKALKLAPKFPDMKHKMALAYRDKGEPEECIRILRSLLRAHPKYTEARLDLGVTLYTEGRQKTALGEWQKVLEVDKKNKTAAMYVRLTGNSKAKTKKKK